MGFSITGQGRQGIIMENSGVPAAPILLFVCGGCPYRGNGCEPSMPTDIKNEIDAKVES